MANKFTYEDLKKLIDAMPPHELANPVTVYNEHLDSYSELAGPHHTLVSMDGTFTLMLVVDSN